MRMGRAWVLERMSAKGRLRRLRHPVQWRGRELKTLLFH